LVEQRFVRVTNPITRLGGFVLLALAAAALPFAAHGEERYVSDKLVLNVYASPEPGSERVATIETGDTVEAVERSGNHTLVRLADGREGWVGSNYLVVDPPAVIQLRALELQGDVPPPAPAVSKAAAEELASLRKQNAALQTEVGELKNKVTAAVAAAQAAAASPGVTEGPQLPPEPAPPATSVMSPLLWLSPLAVVIAGALGFALGFRSLARRLRRKFGGLKIY
jgi:uncharacterized protein YgiM (DUF1202 family)